MSNDMLGNMLLHVNFLAMRAIFAKLLEEHFALSGDPAQKADEWLRFFEKVADTMAFPSETPEWSDLAAQEFRDIVMAIIHQARSQALHEPFDPDAHHRRTP
ncbi:hypothetical protein M5E06_32130 [Azospirillum sp. A1-3]|uniref:hypothetical protein n=1 Tax=Azospirillum sp. A1-3 TaxID=185874 RepID=UPI00207721C5|nr:hypothetical protein [Azospirillum sp. A1-3]MCM8738749.1 hypothetical protein [Azospirillum sp. A1-3]